MIPEEKDVSLKIRGRNMLRTTAAPNDKADTPVHESKYGHDFLLSAPDWPPAEVYKEKETASPMPSSARFKIPEYSEESLSTRSKMPPGNPGKSCARRMREPG